jgi:hypothetical protein
VTQFLKGVFIGAALAIIAVIALCWTEVLCEFSIELVEPNCPNNSVPQPPPAGHSVESPPRAANES